MPKSPQLIKMENNIRKFLKDHDMSTLDFSIMNMMSLVSVIRLYQIKPGDLCEKIKEKNTIFDIESSNIIPFISYMLDFINEYLNDLEKKDI